MTHSRESLLSVNGKLPFLMKIRVLSDLHLEFQSWTPPSVPADVVVLAGDIASGADGIHWGREHFPESEIIYVPGNHEFFGSEIGIWSEKSRLVDFLAMGG